MSVRLILILAIGIAAQVGLYYAPDSVDWQIVIGQTLMQLAVAATCFLPNH